MRRWILTLLLVAGMFAVGTLIGGALQWVLNQPGSDVTFSSAPPAPTPPPAAPTAPIPAAALQGENVRRVADYPEGPVKRALAALHGRIDPIVRACKRQQTDGSRAALPFRFDLEAHDGSATITQALVESPNAVESRVQSCVARQLKTLLLDFPVEDGTYSFRDELPGVLPVGGTKP